MSALRQAQDYRHHGCSLDYPNHRHRIKFLHPAYPNGQNVLFWMYALDHREGGLHHGTALSVCQIIAGNRWDGFLSQNPGGSPIDVELEHLLRSQEYYFVVPHPISTADNVASPSPLTTATHIPTSTINASPYRYPIVPSFRQWRFPRQLPDAWDQIELETNGGGRSNTDGVIPRDVTCRMTNYGEECDAAHLCPETESDWFQDNRMDEYTTELRTSGRAAINNEANVMLLRADLHRSYDKMRFVHVPKRGSQGQLHFVTHLMDHSPELGKLYHNAELHTLGVAKEFLFTRLAYAAFPLLAGFLQQGFKRFLLRTSSNNPSWVEPDDCFAHGEEWKPPNQRSSLPSPTKRSRLDAGIDAAQGDSDINGCTAGFARSKEFTGGNHVSCLPTNHWPSSVGTKETGIATVKPAHCNTILAKTTIPDPPKNMQDSSLTQSLTSEPLTEMVNYSSDVEREKKLAAMREQYLQEDRARSDPQGHWEKEQCWLQDVFDRGGALDASELKRWALAMGYDCVDEVGVD